MKKCTSQINNGSEDHVVMQIQNIINYSHIVITTSNQMIGVHMIIYSHTRMNKYNEK